MAVYIRIAVNITFLLCISCSSVQYIPVPVPYVRDFACPPVVKPEPKPVNLTGMTEEDREVARRYNLAAAERYIKSLLTHIECIGENISVMKKEAASIREELEKR